MLNKKSSLLRSLSAFAASILILVSAGFIYLNRQLIIDQVTVWSYEPSAQLANISKQSGLTSKGEFLLYATRPSIEQAEGFNSKCPRQEQGSPILGCYTPDDRVYIFDVANEQLAGMQEVTAVHEMLHAAWVRLDNSEREKLTVELESAYKNSNNDELKKRMEYYERSEPGEIVNELHSILGTEVRSLGEPLESYYAKLFDRALVLKMHESYSGVYKELYAKADSIYSQMNELASSIEKRSAQYDAALSSYTRDVNSFNSRARGQGFTTQSQFNAERAQLLSRSSALESTRVSINSDIVTYNKLNEEYSSVTAQIDGLNKSLDSMKQLEQVPSA